MDIRRGEDGLRDAWEVASSGIVYVNPPFSNASAWLNKCARESQRLRRVVVALVPAIPGDGPWHNEVWPGCPVVGFIRGRVEFRNPKGRMESKGRGHALCLFGSEYEAMLVAYPIADLAARHPQAPVWVKRWVP